MKNFSKLALVFSVFFLTTTVANAQRNRGFKEGQSDVNVGIGFLSIGLLGDVSVPPLSLSYEYGITKNIGVGAYVGYTASTNNGVSLFGITSPSVDYTYFIVAARGSYHFKWIDNVDTYAGAMAGYNSITVSSESGTNDTGSPIFSSVFGGARYHFTKNLGAFLEVGYGVAAINLGLTAKF